MSHQFHSPPTISLVVCTRNRPEELKRLLKSVENQTYSPREVIVVDASDTDPLSGADTLHVIKAPQGSALQRNVGARAASSDVLVFADDDEVLAKGCLEAVARAFRDDESGRLGAITGRLLSSSGERGGSRMARFFGLGESGGNGRFKLSGFPSLPSGDVEQETETLFGGLMAFRRNVFFAVGGCDERLAGYAYMEDQDIAARVRAAGWRLKYLPGAGFYHFPASGGREGVHAVAKKKVLNSRYILEKNFHPGVVRRAAWWWAMVGMLLIETRAHGIKGAAGVLRGMAQVAQWACCRADPTNLVAES